MIFILFLSFRSFVQNVSGFSPLPRRRALTCLGHFILVCNIVYVPIAALYHVYRLL